MEWYSIKQFTPPSSTDVIVRIIKKEDCGAVFDRFYIAMCEDFETIEDFATWELASESGNFRTYKVTHFALIEPVPICRGEE